MIGFYLPNLLLFILKSLNFIYYVVPLLLKIKVYIKFLFSFTNHALTLFLKLYKKKIKQCYENKGKVYIFIRNSIYRELHKYETLIQYGLGNTKT